MQALLGLIVFSVLLARGASLECVTCNQPDATDCNGPKQECPRNFNACVTTVFQTGGVSSVTKTCGELAACKQLKTEIGKIGTPGANIKKLDCNNAPPQMASLLLALSSLLVMKMLL